MAEKYLFNFKGNELAKRLAEKVVSFQEYAVASGKANNWIKNKDFYENKFYAEDGNMDILDAGEQGEILIGSTNHFRNVIRHILNPIIATPPKFTVTATNSNISCRIAADIGRAIINYYDKVKRFDKIAAQTIEYAVVYGSGYQVEEFNPMLGDKVAKKVIDEKTGSAKLEEKPLGDFDVESISVWDMYFDFTRKQKHDWYIFRRRRNKYDIAESFGGDKKERILNMSPFFTDDLYYKGVNFKHANVMTDDIYVYSAYHKSTPAMPNGKYALFVGTDNPIMLYESDNPYGEDLPVFCVQPAQYLENAFGFADANIIRGSQEAYNDVKSKILTNAQSAIKDVWVGAAGDNAQYEKMASGRVVWKTDQKPEVIDLWGGDNGLLGLLQLFKSEIEILSAQNSIVRGDVASAPNLKSGVALQTVVAMGQQYAHGLQTSRDYFFEDIQTFRLKTLQKVADEKRIIDIVGKTKASNVIEFTKDDLEGISRVIVQKTNPILNTPAGNIEIATQYMQMSNGQFSFKDFLEVVHTGDLAGVTESDTAMLDYVQQVKEALLDGQPVDAIMGTDHAYAIKEIQSLLLNLPFRSNPENRDIVKNIVDFINKSMDLMRQGDQVSALIYGGVAPQAQSVQMPPEQGVLTTPAPEQGFVTPQTISQNSQVMG